MWEWKMRQDLLCTRPSAGSPHPGRGGGKPLRAWRREAGPGSTASSDLSLARPLICKMQLSGCLLSHPMGVMINPGVNGNVVCSGASAVPESPCDSEVHVSPFSPFLPPHPPLRSLSHSFSLPGLGGPKPQKITCWLDSSNFTTHSHNPE